MFQKAKSVRSLKLKSQLVRSCHMGAGTCGSLQSQSGSLDPVYLCVQLSQPWARKLHPVAVSLACPCRKQRHQQYRSKHDVNLWERSVGFCSPAFSKFPNRNGLRSRASRLDVSLWLLRLEFGSDDLSPAAAPSLF